MILIRLNVTWDIVRYERKIFLSLTDDVNAEEFDNDIKIGLLEDNVKRENRDGLLF